MRQLILLLLIITNVTYAEIYQWLDQSGKVNYSDIPIEGAKLITPADNTKNFAKPFTPLKQEDKPIAAEKSAYDLQILSPQDQATLRDNQGNIDVHWSLSPLPKANIHYQLFLNDKLVGETLNQTRFQLTNIDRGAHQLTVSALTSAGEILAETSAQQVYLHRAIKKVIKPQPK